MFLLQYLIAAWTVVTGIMEIASGGVMTILGVILFVFSGAGALGMVSLIGFFTVAFGILHGVLGFRLLGHKKEIEKAAP